MKRVLFYLLSAFLTLGGSTLAMAKQISHTTKAPQVATNQHHQKTILLAEEDDEFPPGVAAGLERREDDDHGEGEGHE